MKWNDSQYSARVDVEIVLSTFSVRCGGKIEFLKWIVGFWTKKKKSSDFPWKISTSPSIFYNDGDRNWRNKSF